MMKIGFWGASATAVAAMLSCPAHAASVSVSEDYAFTLNYVPGDVQFYTFASQIPTYGERSYAGGTSISLAGFDSSLGTLHSVNGTFAGNVEGTIFADPGVGITGQGRIDLSSASYAQPIIYPNIQATANDQGQIDIDLSDSFNDTFTGPSLALFQGSTVPVHIDGSFEYFYNNAGNAGYLESLDVFGSITLTYNYTPVDGTPGPGPTPNPIPTPSAAAAGLVALVGLVSRRRRESVEA